MTFDQNLHLLIAEVIPPGFGFAAARQEWKRSVKLSKWYRCRGQHRQSELAGNLIGKPVLSIKNILISHAVESFPDRVSDPVPIFVKLRPIPEPDRAFDRLFLRKVMALHIPQKMVV